MMDAFILMCKVVGLAAFFALAIYIVTAILRAIFKKKPSEPEPEVIEYVTEYRILEEPTLDGKSIFTPQRGNDVHGWGHYWISDREASKEYGEHPCKGITFTDRKLAEQWIRKWGENYRLEVAHDIKIGSET